MPLGILEDTKLEHVPGTSPLNEVGREDLEVQQGVDSRLLKHDPSGTIVLVPQPSDDPNDPLNWPGWKKDLFTVAIGYGCGCVGATGPLLTAALAPLAVSFGIPLQTFTLGLQGSCIAAIAVGSLVCNTLAVKFGKRPVYLATSVGLAATSFWAAEATSFASLAAARAIMGFCMAPMEALVPASIADIWFVHERGFRTAVFNLGVLGGINLASPIAGAVIQYGSYRIALHAMGGAFVLQLIMTFFWMPESAFKRSSAVNIDTGDLTALSDKGEGSDREKTAYTQQEGPAVAAVSSEGGEGRGGGGGGGGGGRGGGPVVRSSSTATATTTAMSSWARELLPYSGYWDTVSFWRTLIRPFAMLASPVVAWATLLFTTCISWLVLISITLSQIFSGPPYNFSVSAVGASNLSSFAASAIATAVAGRLIDGLVKYMSRLNKGTFEPEFRLPIMTTYLLFTATGFFAWGQSLYEAEPWPVPVIVCLGLISLGVQLGTTGVVTYVVDCHRQQAAEAFAAMNFVKNMFAFGLTFYCNDWIAVQGARGCFFVIGGITAGVTLTTVAMYVWGKRARSLVARYRLVSF